MERTPPRKRNNIGEREHEYVTHAEFKRMRVAAGLAARGDNRHRDQLMILMAFRHGFRSTELIRLKWSQLDLEARTLDVHRSKHGKRAIHDLTVEEVKALKKLAPDGHREGIVFLSEKGKPLTRRTWFGIVQRAGKLAGIKRPIHPHCLRHGCGFYMVEKGTHMRLIQDWLGHRQIQTTVLYTALDPGRLKGAFPDEE